MRSNTPWACLSFATRGTLVAYLSPYTISCLGVGAMYDLYFIASCASHMLSTHKAFLLPTDLFSNMDYWSHFPSDEPTQFHMWLPEPMSAGTGIRIYLSHTPKHPSQAKVFTGRESQPPVGIKDLEGERKQTGGLESWFMVVNRNSSIENIWWLPGDRAKTSKKVALWILISQAPR